MIKFLDLHAQYLSLRGEIDAAMHKVIEESSFIAGPAAVAFEQDFAAYQQTAHCVGVANGTDAIEIILEALDLPKGSEVIVPANSFIASSEAVTRSGLRVVFADVDPDTNTLDPADVVKRIGPNTSALMAVHLYGHPCDMDALGELATKHGLKIIEDCAQAHGAEYKGRRIGALGAAGSFSFYPGKNLGAYGDAGAIVTQDEALAKRCRMIANHGRVEKYNHEFEGRNSRLDGMQAAVLGVKLKRLDAWVDRRNAIARRYLNALAGTPGLTLPVIRADVRHAFHLFVVRTDRRDALASHLQEAGIQTGIHYPIALPKLKAYAYLGQAQEPMRANRDDVRVLSLPIGEHLSDAEIDFVAESVKSFMSRP